MADHLAGDAGAEQDKVWIPLERSRFMEVVAGAVFGLAARKVLRTERAYAQNLPDPDPPLSDFVPAGLDPVMPWPAAAGTGPCWCPRICRCCSGDVCCGNCHGHSYSLGCHTGKRCWWVCTTNGNKYRCCDWHEIVGSEHRACCCYKGYGRC